MRPKRSPVGRLGLFFLETMDLFDNEYARERGSKADALRAAGIAPYAFRFDRTHNATQVHEKWQGLQVGEHSEESVAFAGRVQTLRLQGKAGFAHLTDEGAKLQIYVKKDVIGEVTFEQLFKRIDLGDFIGVKGPIFRTRTGELTVEARELTMLAKTLLPPPDKFHGLKDVELRYRQRYLDLMSNPEVRHNFVKRSRLLAAIRSNLAAKGFLEVETPMLHSVAGGAAARPFVTHHNALDMQLFLRIAPELYLKRLLVGGFERIFELNRNFRNEGISIKHNPEFTMLEIYQAYVDGEAMMVLTEELVAEAARQATGATLVQYQGSELDLTPPFRRITMKNAVREHAGIDVDSLDEAGWQKALPSVAIAKLQGMGPGKRLEQLFSERAEAKLIQPTFVTDFPIEISPLAKRKADNPDVADRFELFIFGREIANGFSELNDPRDQYDRFKAQLDAKAKGDDEAHAMDEDFVRALAHGMPPAGGMGLGIDRLAMLLTDAASIRDVIFFPHMRPEGGGPVE